MKIAFRIDMGTQYGMGHFTRMSAIAEVFTERGCKCNFFTSNEEPVNYHGYDVIIVDTYWVTDEYIEKLNRLGKLLVCIDDNALYTYNCDILINTNLYAPQMNFKFGAKPPKLLLGGEYAMLRSEFRKSEPITVKQEANRVFVCFGGTDICGFTKKIVGIFDELNYIEFVVVFGSVACNYEEVRTLVGRNVTVLRNPPNISEVMQSCDIALISSSTMSYELAALGIPAIAVVQADNQWAIAEYWQTNNLIKICGSWLKYNLDMIKTEILSLLSDYQRRLREGERLRQIVNKNGAYRVAETILETTKNEFTE